MKYFVESYGCTMNYGEGDQLSEKMRALGHVLSDSADDADIVILNTCTVVDTTEKKMLRRISEITKNGKEIIVTGCMAKAQHTMINVMIPGSLIIPPEEYFDFETEVSEKYGCSDPSNIRFENISAVLPIAQGCLGKCSYCITKIARGTLKSYPMDQLIREFDRMIENGAKEVLITAQDTGCYGKDIGTDLPSLLKEILKTSGDYMIRIGMMNPNNFSSISDNLLNVMQDPRIYKFLHIPIQSGSDNVLRGMNRSYTSEEFKTHVEKIRSVFPDMSISTDVISGFPGETDDDHKKTVDLMEWLNADVVNITRFSVRPGTKAASMKDHIHGRISKERSQELTTKRIERGLELNKQRIGNVYEVMVTENGKEKGTVMARTMEYRLVVIDEILPIGSLATVKIIDARPSYLIGRMLNK